MIEWTREYAPDELVALERSARIRHTIMGGLSTHEMECRDAVEDLDRRRQEHERRFRRYRLVQRPATRDMMIERIVSVGATDLTADPDLMHAPVVPVAGGVAFDPDRMTLTCLEEVYNRVRGVRAVDGRVLDRVEQVINTFSTGLREKDIVDLVECSRTAAKRALFMLVAEGKVVVRRENTRMGGTPRKRFFPANGAVLLSADVGMEMGVL
jgi:hypothetical protein